MPETNGHQAGCARKRIFGHLDCSRPESKAVFDLDLRVGTAVYSRGADANGVLKLAEEHLQSSRPPANADQPSRNLAGCAAPPPRRGPGREL